MIKMLSRRLAAIFYDSMLVFCLMLLSTALILPFVTAHVIKPHNYYYTAWLLLLWSGFIISFWYKKGQTLGMLAWHLRLINHREGAITLWQAAIRFFIAVPLWLLLGIGLWWPLIDKDNFSLQDRLSKTRLIIDP